MRLGAFAGPTYTIERSITGNQNALLGSDDVADRVALIGWSVHLYASVATAQIHVYLVNDASLITADTAGVELDPDDPTAPTVWRTASNFSGGSNKRLEEYLGTNIFNIDRQYNPLHAPTGPNFAVVTEVASGTITGRMSATWVPIG